MLNPDIIDIEDIISKNIHLHRLSSRNQIVKAMDIDLSTKPGKDILLAFYLMTSIYEGSGEIIRRDGLPVIRHLYETTTRPQHRFSETGYCLNDEETLLGLLHDLGEDFGVSFEGAMVINHSLGQVFSSPKLEEMLNLLTDRYVLAWDPILKEVQRDKPAFVPMEHTKITHILPCIKERMKRVSADDYLPKSTVDHIIDRTRDHIKKFIAGLNFLYEHKEYQVHENMSIISLDKDDLEEISILLSEAGEKMRISQAGYKSLRQEIKESALNILGSIDSIIREEKIRCIDPSLLTFNESPYLTILNKTFYLDGYVKDLAEAVKSYARKFKGGTDIGTTNPYIVKIADSTDNASNLPKDNPMSATRIFRKSRGICLASLNSFSELERYGFPTGRMRNATLYLIERLISKIGLYLDQARMDADVDTLYSRMLDRLEILLSKDMM